MACTALAAVYLVYGRKEAPPANKGRRLFLLLLAASVLPAFIEPLHRAAHLWSYVDFPVRFGFIPNLVVASFCAWILSGGRLPQPAGRRWGWGWSLGLPVAAFAVSLIVLHGTWWRAFCLCCFFHARGCAGGMRKAKGWGGP